MSVADLINKLEQLPKDYDVMVYNSASGAGKLGVQSVREALITQSDADDCGECEDRVGEPVIVLSFGSY